MAKKDDSDDEDEGKGGLGGKIKLIAMILPTVLLVVGALYFFVLAPKSDGSDPAKAKAKASSSAKGSSSQDDTSSDEETDGPAPEPGALIAVDPITVNLANGHYLQVGLALQATKDAGEEVSGVKAKDAIISQFSGKTVAELATAQAREAAKKALTKTIKKLYEQKVYEIFYTAFVMN
jgi:flagellar protein FliL